MKTPLQLNEIVALQNKSWQAWCLDLIERRFSNVHDGDNYAVFIRDEKEQPKILYATDGVKECLVHYIESEGYGQ